MALKQQKEYHKNKDGPGMIMKTELSKVINGELQIMQTLPAHPNLIHLHSIIDDEEQDKLMVVMDYCPQGQVMTWDQGDLRFNPS